VREVCDRNSAVISWMAQIHLVVRALKSTTRKRSAPVPFGSHAEATKLSPVMFVATDDRLSSMPAYVLLRCALAPPRDSIRDSASTCYTCCRTRILAWAWAQNRSAFGLHASGSAIFCSASTPFFAVSTVMAKSAPKLSAGQSAKIGLEFGELEEETVDFTLCFSDLGVSEACN
jgi:hypothetical protein